MESVRAGEVGGFLFPSRFFPLFALPFSFLKEILQPGTQSLLLSVFDYLLLALSMQLKNEVESIV